MIGSGGSRSVAPQPTVKFESITDWKKGRISRNDLDRTPNDALFTTENVVLSQDGVVGPRPGTKLYGVQPIGTVISKPYEFVYTNTSVTPNAIETWNIWMENRSGTGRVCIAKDGAAATIVAGKTYSSTAIAHFEQVYGKVTITNGNDTFSVMDIQTQMIIPSVALATPVTPSAVATSPLTTSPAGYLNLRYRIAAANQGETAASAAAVVSVNKIRDTWNGTTESVTVSGNRVTGATRYNIYVGDQAGNEYYLDSFSDPGTGTTYTYTDTGTIALTTTRVAPAGDSTAGPRVTRVTNIKGQPYMVGDYDNPGRIWFGGNGANALDFSSYNGGGWVEPNKGGKDFPVKVVPFRDGKGTPMAACLSKGTNGSGKRYLLQPSTTTLGDTVITYMSVTEDNGADGTDSPDGVALTQDAIWYPSRTGFKTSTTKANIPNLISTTGITDNISGDVLSLNSKAMENCVHLVNDRRILWALPVGSSTNNQLWTLDLRQDGAWMTPSYLNIDAMWLYADNTLGTKVLMLINNQFVEYDENTLTNDNGVPFQTNISTGALKFSDDGSIWGSIIDVTFVFSKPQGNINLSVTAQTEDGPETFVDTLPASGKQSVGALGRYGLGAAGLSSLSPPAQPVMLTSSQSRKSWVIPVDEEANMITASVSTTDSGVSYQWTELIIRYVPVGFVEIDND